MKSHYRVVIVGGGIMGVGLQYHLGLEGWSDTLLIEKGRADFRLDLARCRAVSALQWVAEYDQGASLWY